MNRRQMLWTSVAALAGVAGLLAGPHTLARAQGGGGDEPLVKSTATVTPVTVARGGKGTLTLTLKIKDGYHINGVEPGNEFAIATVFTGKAPAGVTYGKPVFPKAKPINMPGFETPINVYEGTAVVTIPFTVAKTAKPGKATVGGSLRYQGCDDSSCFPPDSISVAAPVTVK